MEPQPRKGGSMHGSRMFAQGKGEITLSWGSAPMGPKSQQSLTAHGYLPLTIRQNKTNPPPQQIGYSESL